MQLKLSNTILVLIIFFGAFASKLFSSIDITIGLSIIFIFFNYLKIFPKLNKSLVVLLLIFGLWFASTTFYTEDLYVKTRYYSRLFRTAEPISVFIRLLGYLIITIILSNYYIDDKLWNKIKYSFIVSSLSISAFLIFEFYSGINLFSENNQEIIMEGVTRVKGPFGDPNSSAAMVIPGLIFLLSILIFDKVNKYLTLLVIILISFILWGISLAASRTALLGVIIIFPSLFFLKNRIISRKRKFFYGIMLLILGGLLIRAILRGRSLSLTADASGQSRTDLFNFALTTAVDNPFLGRGYLYGFHNNISDIMVSGGFILLLIFLCFNSKLIFKLYNYINTKKFWILFSLNISFFLVGLGISWTNNIIYWIIIGISLSELSTSKITDKFKV